MNTTSCSTVTGVNTDDNNLRPSPSLPPPRIAPELEDFYNSHNVDLTSILKKTSSSSSSSSSSALFFPYRFIRLNPRYDESETLMILEKEMKEKGEDTTRQSTTTTPIEVSWVGREWKFFAIPSNFPLSTSKSFCSGRVYGMDVSSGAAISALFSSSCLSDKNQEKEEVKNDAIIKDNNNDDDATLATTTTATITRAPGATNNVRILDLCCCPGLKLCAMGDFWETKQQQQQHDSSCTTTTTIVGIDVSENRMALCKKIVQKYHINKETSGICNNMKERINKNNNNTNIQLFCQDGTTFGMNTNDDNLVFDSRAAIEEVNSREDMGGGGSKRKRMNKSARAREKKRLKQFASENWQQQEEEEEEEEEGNNVNVQHRQPQMKPFDYVLVDAECSTDGSLKHLRERLLKKKKGMMTTMTTVPVTGDNIVEEKQEEESNDILTDKQKLADLVDLQQRLLYSGFRLLKRGGMLVYSTCSLSYDQNEGVVNWLLSQQKDAYLIPVEFPETAAGSNNNKLVVSGSLPGTLRFYPNLIGQQQADSDTLSSSLGGLYGDGFFVAKIGKRLLRDMNNDV